MKHFFRMLLWSALALWVSGCAVSNPFGSSEFVDGNLPRVSSIRTLPDVSSVAFEWNLINDPRIDGYYLYRKEVGASGDFERVGRIESRFGAHHVDRELKPGTTYLYKMNTYNKATGGVSPDSEVVEAKTIALEPLGFVQAMSGYPRKVKILWGPHNDPRVSGYVVEREESGKWKSVGKTDSRLLVEYLDMKLEDGKEYRYRVLAKTHEGALSTPSEVVSAVTKPKPPIVQGIVASVDIPKRIELSWEKSTQADVVNYKVYRAPWEKWNYSELTQTQGETSYVDNIDGDGKEYYYKVSAIDVDGIESLLQESPIYGTTLKLPATPVMEYARIENGQVVLRWAPTDDRSVEYVVYKSDGWFMPKTERFVGIKDVNFYDREIVPGKKYYYSVAAVDRHGLESKRSNEVVLLLPQEAR